MDIKPKQQKLRIEGGMGENSQHPHQICGKTIAKLKWSINNLASSSLLDAEFRQVPTRYKSE